MRELMMMIMMCYFCTFASVTGIVGTATSLRNVVVLFFIHCLTSVGLMIHLRTNYLNNRIICVTMVLFIVVIISVVTAVLEQKVVDM